VIDWNISLGNALTIIILGAGGLGFIYSIRGRVDGLGDRMKTMEQQLIRLVDVLVEQRGQAVHISSIDGRILAQGARLDELERRFNRRIETSSST
jgi:hypothetical protein